MEITFLDAKDSNYLNNIGYKVYSLKDGYSGYVGKF